MSEGTPNEPDRRGIGFWIMMALGAILVLYLLGFAVLVLFPQAGRAVKAMGVSNEMLDKIYFPIMRFLQ